MLGVFLNIYTTIGAYVCSVLCLVLIELLECIYALCVFYYLYNYYSASLLSALLITNTTIIV